MTDATPPSESVAPIPSADQIEDWIVAQLARQTEGMDVEITAESPLMSLGIDSMQFIGLIGDLEQWLGCTIVDNPLPEYPTIRKLSVWLASEIEAGRTQLDPSRTSD